MCKILEANEKLVRQFLKNAGNSLNSFRYYKNRPIKIIENHKCTVVLSKRDNIVGYGHLDEENKKTWLGICIVEFEKGKGYGKKIMNYLIEFIKSHDIKIVYLTVDSENIAAIKLYKKYFFKIERKISSETVLMKLKL